MILQEKYMASILPENNTLFSKSNISKLLKALHNMDCEWFHTEEQDTPDMTVKIWGGTFFVNGEYRTVGVDASDETITITSPVFTVPAGDDRVDLLYGDVETEEFGVTQGVEAVTPIRPVIDSLSKQVPVTYIYHRVGSTGIRTDDDAVNSYIVRRNIRPVVSVGGGSGGGSSTFVGLRKSAGHLIADTSENDQRTLVAGDYLDSYFGNPNISINSYGHLITTFL